MKKKRFMGMTTLITKPSGELEKFFTTAPNEDKGSRALQRKMNKIRGCNPEAYIPGMEITEVPETPHAP